LTTTIHDLTDARKARPSREEIAHALSILAAAILAPASAANDDELLTVAEIAALAKCGQRAVRDAIRAGDLPAFGNQKTRASRRRDAATWIESRRAPTHTVDDADLDRRIDRLERAAANGGR